jgi:hypothetical protein
MNKVMYVTMGTSLFFSASWEGELPVDERDKKEFRHYRAWLDTATSGDERRCPLRSPEARLDFRYADLNKSALKKHLRGDNGREWAEALPPRLLEGDPVPGDEMRYCAELATLLYLYQSSDKEDQEGWDDPSFAGFLRSYSKIEVVMDDRMPASGNPNRAFIAGNHLIAYLNRIAGSEIAAACKIPGFSSTDPDELLGATTGLGALMAHLFETLAQTARVDLVISGGYKLYGLALTPLLRRPDWAVRFLYIHEEGERLIQMPRIVTSSPKPLAPTPADRQVRRDVEGIAKDVGVF